MFDEDHPLVQLKLEILRRAMPARDAIVFGDIYGVHGAMPKSASNTAASERS